jgi:hypothetical protein
MMPEICTSGPPQIGLSGGHWTDDLKIAEAGLTALHQVPTQGPCVCYRISIYVLAHDVR